jgi:ribosome-associated protein
MHDTAPKAGASGEARSDDAWLELAPNVKVPRGVVEFAYARSGGPGGQNVNKVSSRCQLRIALSAIPIHPEARQRLEAMAGRWLVGRGEGEGLAELLIDSDEHRTQSRNRDECLERLRALLLRAIPRPKTRRKTKPSRGSIERRLTEKKTRSAAKRRRSSGGDE